MNLYDCEPQLSELRVGSTESPAASNRYMAQRLPYTPQLMMLADWIFLSSIERRMNELLCLLVIFVLSASE